jgi:hypothetical protein
MARTFTVVNSCPFTIWPAIFTDSAGTPTPNQPTGWVAAPDSSVTFTVPDNWQGGRIWGRRDCDFTTNPGPTSCLDGGCNGGLICTDANFIPPVTLAEFTLSNDPTVDDFYDISLVQGYNFPMRIDNDQGCGVPQCPVDLGPDCPAPLQGPYDSTGFPVGCKSACVADLSADNNNSPNCCSGSFNTPATCPSSGVQYYDYFKSNCPDTYAYPFDESSGTALFSCPSTSNADYVITFCP